MLRFDLDGWLDEEGVFDANRVESFPFSLGKRACFGTRFAVSPLLSSCIEEAALIPQWFDSKWSSDCS